MARKVTVGDILDTSFRIYRQSFPIFLGLGALYIPVTIGWQLLSRLQSNLITDPGSALLTSFGMLLVVGLLTAIYNGSICWASFTAARGDRPGFLACMAMGVRRMPSLAISGIVFLMSIGAGFAFCFIPGFILMAVLGLYLQAIVLEGTGPFAALGRSASITEGSRWTTFWVMVIPGIIVSIIEGVIGTIAVFATGAGQPGFLEAVFSFATMTGWRWYLYIGMTALSSVVLGPLSAIPQTVLFMSLRDEKEGSELEHRVDSLMGTPAGETGRTEF